VIPYFTVRLIEGKTMPLYRNSLNRREWLHVIDHCRAIDLILKEGRIGETYHVGSGLELNVEEIADRLITIFGLDESFKEYVPDRPGHDRRYLLDTDKIQSELGWQPLEDFESGFEATVRWYRENESWWRPLIGRSPVNEESWKNPVRAE
jgi:dTDP-glucose 4,6-dehydratase